MNIGLAFWILMLIWLVLGGFSWYGTVPIIYVAYFPFILFVLLGWRCFGPPLRNSGGQV